MSEENNTNDTSEGMSNNERRRRSRAAKLPTARWWCENRKDFVEAVFDKMVLWDDTVHSLPEDQSAALTKFCWACGLVTSQVESCHIISQSQGGSGHQSNLMLLCKECHHQAPSVSFNTDVMITWVLNRPSYFSERLMLLKKVFEPYTGLIKEPDVIYILRAFTRLMKRSDNHLGRMSLATMEACLSEALMLIVDTSSSSIWKIVQKTSGEQ